MKKIIKRIFTKASQRSKEEIMKDVEYIKRSKHGGSLFYPAPNANTLLPSVDMLMLETLLDIREKLNKK